MVLENKDNLWRNGSGSGTSHVVAAGVNSEAMTLAMHNGAVGNNLPRKPLANALW